MISRIQNIKIACVFFVLFLSLTSFSQIPTTGLVGAWPFNGNANDISGNGNNGTVHGASLTTDRCGNANSAYNFNGSNNYIQTLFAGPTGSVSRTVSFWARTSNTNLMTAFAYGNSSGGLAYALQYNYNCAGVGVDVNNQALTRGNSCVINNQWHHIVAILNSTISTQLGGVIFYVDAILQPSISCVISGSVQTVNTGSNYPISFGRIHDASARFFTGDIDDIYLYDRAISTTEIQQLYTACSPPVFGNTITCSGVSNTYSISPFAGVSSYSWSLPGTWSGISSTNTIQVISGTGSGIIQVSGMNSCGGTMLATTQVSVILNNFTISASSNSICSGNSVTLTTNNTGNSTWLPGNLTSSLIVVNPSSTTSYSLNSNLSSCTSTQSIIINVIPIPTIMIASSSTSICAGSSATLTGSGGNSYTFFPGGTGANIVITPSITTTYSVVGSNTSGCSNNASLTLNVIPVPTINITSSPTTICAGSSATLTGSGGTSYTFFPGGAGTNIVITPSITTTYSVVGNNDNGCKNNASLTLNVSKCTGLINTKITNTEIKLYPNPSNGLFNIEVDSNYSVAIINFSGQLVYSSQVSSGIHQISLGDLASGIYVLKIQNDVYSKNFKIVKE